jgi:hypothetical protein
MTQAHHRSSTRRWLLVTVVLAGVLSASLAACGHSTPRNGAIETPRVTPYPGERWGDFVFCDQPAPCYPTPSDVTPAPIPLDPGEGETLFSGPGYHEFKTVEELGAFIGDRAVFRVPRFLPNNAELLGGYAVEKRDGRVFDVGLSYRLGNTDATILNSDLWINYDLYTEKPITIGKESPPSYTYTLLTVRGEKAIFQKAFDAKSRASLNWFEGDGSFWAAQGVGLDLATMVAIAESLTDYQP